MEGDHGDRVHSVGLSTVTVESTVLYVTKERSQPRRYDVQGCGVPSRAIREKVKCPCHRHFVPFGL
jgi:hypothetical protein